MEDPLLNHRAQEDQARQLLLKVRLFVSFIFFCTILYYFILAQNCTKGDVGEDTLKTSGWYNTSMPPQSVCELILNKLCSATDAFDDQAGFGMVESKSKELFCARSGSGNASIVMGPNPKLVEPECYSCASQAFLNKP